MIVKMEAPMGYFSRVLWYSACLGCGWCSQMKDTEAEAGEADDAHLAAKLAAR